MIHEFQTLSTHTQYTYGHKQTKRNNSIGLFCIEFVPGTSSLLDQGWTTLI